MRGKNEIIRASSLGTMWVCVPKVQAGNENKRTRETE